MKKVFIVPLMIMATGFILKADDKANTFSGDGWSDVIGDKWPTTNRVRYTPSGIELIHNQVYFSYNRDVCSLERDPYIDWTPNNGKHGLFYQALKSQKFSPSNNSLCESLKDLAQDIYKSDMDKTVEPKYYWWENENGINNKTVQFDGNEIYKEPDYSKLNEGQKFFKEVQIPGRFSYLMKKFKEFKAENNLR